VNAASALGKMGAVASAAVPALIKALSDKEVGVKRFAAIEYKFYDISS